MFYIKEKDYEFIANKYHDTKEPFNGIAWIGRNDAIFSQDTGMDADRMIEGIYANDKQYKTLSHAIRKARAMEFVLENTKILCDPRDLFPAINCVDRPLYKTLIHDWEEEVFAILPGAKEEIAFLRAKGMARPALDYMHGVPVWDTLLELGFSGVLNRANEAKASLESKRTLNEEELAFFESIQISYEAIIRFVGRLAALAEKTDGCENMAKALNSIKGGAATTFYEALMFEFLYFMISELVDLLPPRTLGNFDRLFYPYYQNDLKNGVSEETLRTQLAYYFMQFTALGNYWGQPVYLGGTDGNGDTNINPLSYVFLDVYDKMGIYNPKIQIKYSLKIPEDFTLKALDMIRRGHNSIVFVSEDHIRKSLRYNGIDEREVVHTDVRGCYEFLLHGAMDTEDQQINLLKPLEYVLHGGRDGLTGELIGLEEPVCFDTFEELFDAYKRQLKNLIDRVITLVNSLEGYLGYINPTSLPSATFPACLERAKDSFSGGGRTNNTYMLLGAVASIADSLMALKKYVYDEKIITLEEFIKVLDHNFVGYEAFRNKLVNDKEKYGNNLEAPDSIAREVVSFACDCIEKRPNAPSRGGYWSCGAHIARGIYFLGEASMASPNGRLSGEELSKNMSPTMGANHKGLTAAVLSVTSFDMMRIQLDASLDAVISPSAAKGEEGLRAMLAVLNTFIELGGQAIHINMTDAETLRKAQKDPEHYKDIQVRVSGWNVLFHNVNKEEQDGFIRQAEVAGL